jgi:hypothetical protein
MHPLIPLCMAATLGAECALLVLAFLALARPLRTRVEVFAPLVDSSQAESVPSDLPAEQSSLIVDTG